jgi:hypothetical protein
MEVYDNNNSNNKSAEGREYVEPKLPPLTNNSG